MRKRKFVVASFASFFYLVGSAALASETGFNSDASLQLSNCASSLIAQAPPTDYYPQADPTMPGSTQPYTLPGQAAPDLRPGYPSSYPGAPVNSAPQITVGHHHHHHSNKQHKHSHKIHVVRAVKHVVGFSAKAPLSVVP